DGGMVEIGGEVGGENGGGRYGDRAGHRVRCLDRVELVAQVFLDDVLHVIGQVGQPLLDVGPLGPDAVGDQQLVIVAQVHEGGEVVAQAGRAAVSVADVTHRARCER